MNYIETCLNRDLEFSHLARLKLSFSESPQEFTHWTLAAIIDSRILIFSVESGLLLLSLECLSYAPSPNSDVFVYSPKSQSCKMIDLSERPTNICASRSSEWIALGFKDRFTINSFKNLVERGRENERSFSASGGISCFRWSISDNLLTVCGDGEVNISFPDGTFTRFKSSKTNERFLCGDWDPSGNKYALGSSLGRVAVYQLLRKDDSKLIYEFEAPLEEIGFGNDISSICNNLYWIESLTLFATYFGDDGFVSVWFDVDKYNSSLKIATIDDQISYPEIFDSQSDNRIFIEKLEGWNMILALGSISEYSSLRLNKDQTWVISDFEDGQELKLDDGSFPRGVCVANLPAQLSSSQKAPISLVFVLTNTGYLSVYTLIDRTKENEPVSIQSVLAKSNHSFSLQTDIDDIVKRLKVHVIPSQSKNAGFSNIILPDDSDEKSFTYSDEEESSIIKGFSQSASFGNETVATIESKVIKSEKISQGESQRIQNDVSNIFTRQSSTVSFGEQAVLAKSSVSTVNQFGMSPLDVPTLGAQVEKLKSSYPPMSTKNPTPFSALVSKPDLVKSSYPSMSIKNPSPFAIPASSKNVAPAQSSYPPMSIKGPTPFGTTTSSDKAVSIKSSYPPMSTTGPTPFGTAAQIEKVAMSKSSYPPMSTKNPSPFVIPESKNVAPAQSSYPPMSIKSSTPFGATTSSDKAVSTKSSYPPMSTTGPTPFGATVQVEKVAPAKSSYPPMSAKGPTPFGRPLTSDKAMPAMNSYPPISLTSPTPSGAPVLSDKPAQTKSSYPPMSAISPTPFGTAAQIEEVAVPKNSYPPMSTKSPTPFDAPASSKESTPAKIEYPPMSIKSPTPYGTPAQTVKVVPPMIVNTLGTEALRKDIPSQVLYEKPAQVLSRPDIPPAPIADSTPIGSFLNIKNLPSILSLSESQISYSSESCTPGSIEEGNAWAIILQMLNDIRSLDLQRRILAEKSEFSRFSDEFDAGLSTLENATDTLHDRVESYNDELLEAQKSNNIMRAMVHDVQWQAEETKQIIHSEKYSGSGGYRKSMKQTRGLGARNTVERAVLEEKVTRTDALLTEIKALLKIHHFQRESLDSEKRNGAGRSGGEMHSFANQIGSRSEVQVSGLSQSGSAIIDAVRNQRRATENIYQQVKELGDRAAAVKYALEDSSQSVQEYPINHLHHTAGGGHIDPAFHEQELICERMKHELRGFRPSVRKVSSKVGSTTPSTPAHRVLRTSSKLVAKERISGLRDSSVHVPRVPETVPVRSIEPAPQELAEKSSETSLIPISEPRPLLEQPRAIEKVPTLVLPPTGDAVVPDRMNRKAMPKTEPLLQTPSKKDTKLPAAGFHFGPLESKASVVEEQKTELKPLSFSTISAVPVEMSHKPSIFSSAKSLAESKSIFEICTQAKDEKLASPKAERKQEVNSNVFRFSNLEESIKVITPEVPAHEISKPSMTVSTSLSQPSFAAPVTASTEIFVEAPKQSKTFSSMGYREKVEEIYRVHNPSKLEEVPSFMEKYKGKEDVLVEKLIAKYKVTFIAGEQLKPAQNHEAGQGGVQASAPFTATPQQASAVSWGTKLAQDPFVKASTAASPFGAPLGGSSFGVPASSPFGAPTASPFGTQQVSRPFSNQPTPGLFGTQPSPSPFGSQLAPSSFASQPTPSPFSAPSPFGGQQAGSGFGNKSAAPFGTPQPINPSPFGSGAINPSPFGQGANTPSPFSSSASQSEQWKNHANLQEWMKQVYIASGQNQQLDKIPSFLAKYTGREVEMVKRLCEKYGATPPPGYTEPPQSVFASSAPITGLVKGFDNTQQVPVTPLGSTRSTAVFGKTSVPGHTPIFGTPLGTPGLLGKMPSNGGGFAAYSNQSPFSNATPSSNAFGGGLNNAFGASTPSPFATATPSPFGGSTPSPFGGNQGGTNAFGGGLR